MNDSMHWTQVSETSVMLYLGESIDVTRASVIGRISQRIGSECQHVQEVIPSYTSIMVEVNWTAGISQKLENSVLEIARQELAAAHSLSGQQGKRIELPVYYHPDVGMDLLYLAERSRLTVDEVVQRHSAVDYTVCAIGFAPGFAFLGEVDEQIAQARHDSPRAVVPAGSVGIADRQTAVYPGDSPGGWQIIGRCPIRLYEPGQEPMSPFEVGDRVRFVPIDRATFVEKGGKI